VVVVFLRAGRVEAFLGSFDMALRDDDVQLTRGRG
jgi:hypothetical protein